VTLDRLGQRRRFAAVRGYRIAHGGALELFAEGQHGLSEQADVDLSALLSIDADTPLLAYRKPPADTLRREAVLCPAASIMAMRSFPKTHGH
jgi:hypothetical protein